MSEGEEIFVALAVTPGVSTYRDEDLLKMGVGRRGVRWVPFVVCVSRTRPLFRITY